jgi:predicted DNA-binding ribbon-helix-helix protein
MKRSVRITIEGIAIDIIDVGMIQNDRFGASVQGKFTHYGGVHMKSLRQYSISVAGRRTRVRLGSAMWNALHYIANQTGSSVSALVTEIVRARNEQNLDTAIRNYVVSYHRAIIQTALHGDARRCCTTIPAGGSERNITGQ